MQLGSLEDFGMRQILQLESFLLELSLRRSKIKTENRE